MSYIVTPRRACNFWPMMDNLDGREMTDFSAMYQKYAPEVFRFALYLSGNHGEAEDIVSETFVRAWTSAEHIEMPTLRGYLFTIARNLFLQGRRKSVTQPDH